jgi:hypothetical protein
VSEVRTDEVISRRVLRHMLMRRRNERIAADRDADGMPSSLRMGQESLDALLVDNDPGEQFAMDWLGKEFLRIPILVDPRLQAGVVEVDW